MHSRWGEEQTEQMNAPTAMASGRPGAARHAPLCITHMSRCVRPDCQRPP